MSVLIKGMEMPKNCWECPLQEYGNCFANGDKPIDKNIEKDSRDDSCPLVPVPPHGDLIDRDALREDWLENGENEYVYDTNAFLASLDGAPTILEAEEGER